MKILCIIPIYNKETKLGDLLDDIKKFKLKDDRKIDFLLINNNSTDRSLNTTQKLGQY